MTHDTDDPQVTAVDHLTDLGLGVYAARTYVALVGLGSATASEVSDVVDVPRPRVYDAVEELQGHGLVDVRYASPRRFWPVSARTAGRTFRRDYGERIDDLVEALQQLETTEHPGESVGVLTVTGRAAVTDRCLSFVERADERVVFASVEPLLTEDVTEALAAASERGVEVRIAGMSEAVEERLAESVPGAEPFESLWTHGDNPAGRLLMVDDDRTLVSVLNDHGVGDGDAQETAVWGAGASNHLVVVLRAIFSWRLGDVEG